ncbi:MAG: dTDP-4-amino-4,6-dideoxygalactose transaminase [Bacteroidota bacterium]
MAIPFNIPYSTGQELTYIGQAIKAHKTAGDGPFTKLCQAWMEQRYGFKKCLLTTSCTDALELAALLLNIQPGDEVIVPSYTFVSTVNAFALRGAHLVFADSTALNPNIDPEAIKALITPRTKAIVVVHYAGMACDMEAIMQMANEYQLFVVEDAAQAIDAYYQHKPLGSFGHLAAFSFHETKNIQSGEGGMLVVNDARFSLQAEILREKGTNRAAFFRGEVDKYGWVAVGSSFLASDITAAFLYAQLEQLTAIQAKRCALWQAYQDSFMPLAAKGLIKVPEALQGATSNGHLYYLVCKDIHQRNALIACLKEQGIQAVFHYLSLHSSAYFAGQYKGAALPYSDYYSDCLVRLPLYADLSSEQQSQIINCILDFFKINL